MSAAKYRQKIFGAGQNDPGGSQELLGLAGQRGKGGSSHTCKGHCYHLLPKVVVLFQPKLDVFLQKRLNKYGMESSNLRSFEGSVFCDILKYLDHLGSTKMVPVFHFPTRSFPPASFPMLEAEHHLPDRCANLVSNPSRLH